MFEPNNSICNNPKGLPVIYNEFCTTWGAPSADNIHQILEMIKDKDMDYLIIDAYAMQGSNLEFGLNWKFAAKVQRPIISVIIFLSVKVTDIY